MSSNPKWKQAERRFATSLQRGAGRVTDPILVQLVTSTGRVGDITKFGYDILVGNKNTALVGECKRRAHFLGADAMKALLQIIRISFEWKRTPVLGFTFTDDVPEFIDTKGEGEKIVKKRIPRDWVLVPLPYFESLLEAQRTLDEREK